MSIRGLIIGILTALCLLVLPTVAQSYLIVVDDNSPNVSSTALAPIYEVNPDLVFEDKITLRFQPSAGANAAFSLVSEGDDLDLQRALLYKMSGLVIKPDSTIEETFITYRFYTLEESYKLNTRKLNVTNARLFVSLQHYNWRELYDSTKTTAITNREEPKVDDFVALETEPQFDYPRLGALVQYPEIARRAGIEGRVLVAALVNEQGIVNKAHIIESDNQIFQPYAMRAVILTEFTPASANGKPVKTWVRIPILFKLK